MFGRIQLRQSSQTDVLLRLSLIVLIDFTIHNRQSSQTDIPTAFDNIMEETSNRDQGFSKAILLRFVVLVDKVISQKNKDL